MKFDLTHLIISSVYLSIYIIQKRMCWCWDYRSAQYILSGFSAWNLFGPAFCVNLLIFVFRPNTWIAFLSNPSACSISTHRRLPQLSQSRWCSLSLVRPYVRDKWMGKGSSRQQHSRQRRQRQDQEQYIEDCMSSGTWHESVLCELFEAHLKPWASITRGSTCQMVTSGWVRWDQSVYKSSPNI